MNREMYHRKSSESRRGVSLVIVLSCLVLLSALVIAFLTQMETELKSSKLYAEAASARILFQSAGNIVIAGVKEATHGIDEDGKTLAWASQPGMIRTFGDDGNLVKTYKLYSHRRMIDAAALDQAHERAQIERWYTDSARYVDLNEPVEAGGVKHYPIASPEAVGTTEGFSISGAPIKPNVGTNPCPMPVEWLYVLADGTVSSLDPNGEIEGADRSPIVGRIAFWTDDESAKININTAAEGTYWDTPRTSSIFDGRNLAMFQPSQNEFQRYPGHPAMNCLSVIFPALTREQIYTIVPRVVGGNASSLGGTKKGSAILSPDANRLYASVDELIFGTSMTGGERSANALGIIDKRMLDKSRFFLTASSRAPDLNLFNRPRVSLWPIYNGEVEDRLTGYDRLIAFCSKINGHSYFFQRENPASPTHDLPVSATPSSTGLARNRFLLEYLRHLTDERFPGFGGNTFANKYATSQGLPSDRDQILTSIFDYIRSTNLLDPNLAWNKSFTKRYVSSTVSGSGAGSGQVVPIEDTLTGTRGFGRFPTIQGLSLLVIGAYDNASNSSAQPKRLQPGTIPAPPANQITVQAALVPQLFDPSQGYPSNWSNYKVRISGTKDLSWNGTQMFPTSKDGAITSMISPASPYKMWGDHAYGGQIGSFNVASEKVWSPNAYPWISSRVNMPHPNPESAPAPITHPTFTFSGGIVRVDLLAPDDTLLQSVELNLPRGSFPVPRLAFMNAWVDFRFFIGNNGYGNRASRFDSSDNQYNIAWVRSEDVVRSIVPAVGDMRVLMPRKTILATDSSYSTFFKVHRDYHSTEMRAHSLRSGSNVPHLDATGGRLAELPYPSYSAKYTGGGTDMNTQFPLDCATVPAEFVRGVALGKTTQFDNADPSEEVGDFDNGVAYVQDGPYINKADEGDSAVNGASDKPYFHYSEKAIVNTLFSPNRMVPSAGILGSLPSQVWANKPWQTLLFRPGPAAHYGLQSPPDHLWLDLFHMPVVEPYAISEPLSTAGRINMNYQLVPFNYIKRDTGIRSVLKSEKLISIPDSSAEDYKAYGNNNSTGTDFRLNLDIDETLRGFEERFANNDVFRSASEICSVHLVPAGGAKYEEMNSYWKTKRLTGDNSRERPYATIYPRLTTKSNTFTIHIRAQSLEKVKGTNPLRWLPGKDLVTGEFRGSQMIERYIDPNDSTVPDYADPAVTTPIADFYKIRVINMKQFAP